MDNQLTRLLKIKFPVIQGGMMEISRARLTAAVSNAGGLGTLGQLPDLEAWRDEIQKTRELTDLPFSVNLPLHIADFAARLQIVLDEGVKVVTTAAGNPAQALPDLKAAGVTTLHVVGSVEQARKVEGAGVEAIVAEGGESGGMVARDRVSTLVLVPAVADAVKVPVVAAGGIADARGLLAALCLGAQGVQLGTRFLASPECEAAEKWKDAIIRARDTDTRVVPRGKAQGRVLKDELLSGAMAGVVSGLIREQQPAALIIERMMREAAPLLEAVADMVKADGFHPPR